MQTGTTPAGHLVKILLLQPQKREKNVYLI